MSLAEAERRHSPAPVRQGPPCEEGRRYSVKHGGEGATTVLAVVGESKGHEGLEGECVCLHRLARDFVRVRGADLGHHEGGTPWGEIEGDVRVRER